MAKGFPVERQEAFDAFSRGQHSLWNGLGGYRGHASMCLSCYDDKMAHLPLCHRPPQTPPSPLWTAVKSQGWGRLWPSTNLLPWFTVDSFTPTLPKSGAAHPRAASMTGGLLTSELMENGARHTPQIRSDCPGGLGESFVVKDMASAAR
ncbi:hypothetical protein WMY93_017327 [Mugilogobius chulae]|uniref:Uncharacterized protein n=1 Tax=Mugilogobius chulae TaxID=88201 RepID=A0AAW0NY14_9GOBI